MTTGAWDVLVIGGGATGAGVARDCAMRGLRTILVEQADLTHGTTGRYHGLLHSGARYVVNDPQSARECIAENVVLRRVAAHVIEDTGGLFVSLPDDDPLYADGFAAACRACGIPCEEISLTSALRREPRLNPRVTRAFAVPDAAADSFLATRANVDAARDHGAEVRVYHEVTRLIRDRDAVVGAIVRDRTSGAEHAIHAAVTINAAGPWAARIAALAGVRMNMALGKGTMLALNHRLTNTVLNRCKPPHDGDILVPIRTVSVIGTTDYRVGDPERYAIEPWEVAFLLAEGDKLIPGLSRARVLRAWAGVRPLHAEDDRFETRDISRTYALLDHRVRDGVDGLLTITGGKWTTYRRMAQAATDAACARLGVARSCRTHLEPLAASASGRTFSAGRPLARVERAAEVPEIVCECELATAEDVRRAIAAGAVTLDDVRRETRLGMGPCQGGFCALRATGLLHAAGVGDPAAAAVALTDFVAERWKGLRPILWGAQLQQARFDEMIFHGLVHIEALDTQGRMSPMTDFYARGGDAPIDDGAGEPRADEKIP